MKPLFIAILSFTLVIFIYFFISKDNFITIPSTDQNTANDKQHIIKPFIANYKITTLRNREEVGLSGQSTYILAYKNDIWHSTFDASLLTAEVHESAKFTIRDDLVIPQHYSKHAKGAITSDILINFYYNTNQPYLTYSNYTQQPIFLDVHAIDHASFLLQVRLDLVLRKPRFHYNLVNDDQQIQTVDYKISNYRDLIKTPIGTFNTIRVEADGVNEHEQTTLWLSPKWDYLIIKLISPKYMIELTNAAIIEADGKKTIVKDNAQMTDKSLYEK